jgi:hypothetical protein
MNGWLLVRITGIVVGIATLLRVATNEGIVTYDPLFLAWMDRLRDLVELGFLTDFIGPFLHWGIEQVRGFGISVPDLQDEWRPAFVLSTLMFAAMARHSRSGLLVVAAPVGALVIAAWSGLVGDLFPMVLAVIVATAFASSAVAFATIAAAFALAGSAVAAQLSDAAAVVAYIVFAAILLLLRGAFDVWAGSWHALFANANFNIGIDILFTMTFAFLIAVTAANPPIW